MNGRIYDPLLGRFLSADSYIDGAFNLQGYNRYTYVHNNPLRLTDPTGYMSHSEERRRRERQRERRNRSPNEDEVDDSSVDTGSDTNVESPESHPTEYTPGDAYWDFWGPDGPPDIEVNMETDVVEDDSSADEQEAASDMVDFDTWWFMSLASS